MEGLDLKVFVITLLAFFALTSSAEAKKTFCRAKGIITTQCTTAQDKADAKRKFLRQDRRHVPQSGSDYSGDHEGRGALAEAPTITVPKHRREAKKRPTIRLARGPAEGGQILTGVVSGGATATARILPHPEGCPRSRFCGCGASLRVFGQNIRSLWLAANWFRYPPATPAPGRVAVRRGHVFVIEQVLDRGLVLAYDANSGGRKTRLHVRSLAGYSVRDPRGS